MSTLGSFIRERRARSHFTAAKNTESRMSRWGFAATPGETAALERQLAGHIAWLEKHGMPSDEWLLLSGFNSYVEAQR